MLIRCHLNGKIIEGLRYFAHVSQVLPVATANGFGSPGSWGNLQLDCFFMVEKPIEMDDLYRGSPISGNLIYGGKKELNYVKLKFYVYLEDLARSEEKHLKLGFIATGPTVFRLSV